MKEGVTVLNIREFVEEMEKLAWKYDLMILKNERTDTYRYFFVDYERLHNTVEVRTLSWVDDSQWVQWNPLAIKMELDIDTKQFDGATEEDIKKLEQRLRKLIGLDSDDIVEVSNEQQKI